MCSNQGVDSYYYERSEKPLHSGCNWTNQIACFDHPTGLFRVRGNFDTPLNSVVDGPILKSFEVVIGITG